MRNLLAGRGHLQIIAVSAENTAAASPRVGREARTADRITDGHCPEHRANEMMIAFLAKLSDRRSSRGKVVARAVGREPEPLDANAEIFHEEIFDIGATAPGVIAAEELIIAPALTGLKGFEQAVAMVLRAGERVCAPETDIPFGVTVPGANFSLPGRLNFFSGIRFRSRPARMARSWQEPSTMMWLFFISFLPSVKCFPLNERLETLTI